MRRLTDARPSSTSRRPRTSSSRKLTRDRALLIHRLEDFRLARKGLSRSLNQRGKDDLRVRFIVERLLRVRQSLYRILLYASLVALTLLSSTPLKKLCANRIPSRRTLTRRTPRCPIWVEDGLPMAELGLVDQSRYLRQEHRLD